jgi:hypothetical protein
MWPLRHLFLFVGGHLNLDPCLVISRSCSIYRCHHCHSAIEVFEQAAKQLSPHSISIGKLDIEANKETKNK